MITKSLDKQRIIDSSIPEPNTGCWIWMLDYASNGYGRLQSNKKRWIASRASAHIFFDGIPDGMFVLHKCDNPACVNPDHLEFGGAKENSQQMVSRGRAATGKRNSAFLYPERVVRGSFCKNSKLTEDIVVDVLNRIKSGETQRSIAKDLNITYKNISLIARGKTWKHVTIPGFDYSNRAIGSNNHKAKLNEDLVRYIKRKLLTGVPQKEIAEETGVGFRAISQISRGNIWRHVDA